MQSLLAAMFITVMMSLMMQHPATAQSIHPNLTRYTELDGLPAPEVSRIIQDQFGYIWAGSINGLTRFDGYEFKRFYSNPNDPGSIRGLQIQSIYEDSRGQIWVASSPENVNVYDPKTESFRHYAYKHLIEHPANVELIITSFCEDKSGRIYMGITGGMSWHIVGTGLLYFDESDDSIRVYETHGNVAIENVGICTTDPEGNVWIASSSGLFRIDGYGELSDMLGERLDIETDQGYPTNMISDSEGGIWFTRNPAALSHYDPSEDTWLIYKPEEQPVGASGDFRFNVVKIDPQGKFWIGSNQGLYFFDPAESGSGIRSHESNVQLNQVNIWDLHFDSFGSLWIGTAGHGMYKYEEKAVFTSYRADRKNQVSILPGWVNNIVETQNGQLLITTSGMQNESGISFFDPLTEAFRSIPFQDLLAEMWVVFGIRETTPDLYHIWGNPGLFQFSALDNTMERIKLEGLPEDVIGFDYHIDSMGNLWVASVHGLYGKSSGSDAFEWYDLAEVDGGEEASNEIRRLYEGNARMWLLTINGLFSYDYESARIERHGYDLLSGDVFLSQDFNSFYEDPDGIAWVGMWQGGLSRYDVATGTIHSYTRNDGLPSMSIQGILPDEENGVMWLSTFDGLSRYDIATEQFLNFSLSDGIQGQLFAEGSALKTSQGLFVFGGSHGLTLFPADVLSSRSAPPQVFLTRLDIDNERVVPGGKSVLEHPIYETEMIRLRHNQNNVSISFSALHYSDPSRNSILYKLEPFDLDWRDAGSRFTAYYPRLPSGSYTFRVKAANNHGVWNEEGASVRLTILPPRWRTIWAYGFYALFFAGGVFFIDRYQRKRLVRQERERARDKELEQAKEIEKAYKNLEVAHEDLKAAQDQLVQQEKLASLGQLTAGIAHEIKNPLNFVNNFSEISNELIDELKSEKAKGKSERDEALEEEILNDISQNLEKINYHGKRADAIVKGMLQHSRTSSGVKEPTDINELADEYLRLSYHGLRAKDKSFNADFKTDFDPNLPKVEVIPQDIGRVLLNLINNAFDAVNEKAKDSDPGFRPTVKVSTRFNGKNVEMMVKDNGNGIPEEIKTKIFQPFFTTKPTGQGTGLGLSLSYDIVNAHGGVLKVETIEVEGSEFIIQLPVV